MTSSSCSWPLIGTNKSSLDRKLHIDGAGYLKKQRRKYLISFFLALMAINLALHRASHRGEVIHLIHWAAEYGYLMQHILQDDDLYVIHVLNEHGMNAMHLSCPFG
jgi:hypothetical protein